MYTVLFMRLTSLEGREVAGSLMLFLPIISSYFYIFSVSSLLFFGVLNNLEDTIKIVPTIDVETWIRKTLDFYKTSQRILNYPIFMLITYRYSSKTIGFKSSFFKMSLK